MTLAAKPPRSVPYARLSFFYFCYFAFIGAYGSYFGLLLQSRGFTAPQIALLLSLMQVMRVIAPFLWGSLADSRGQRVAIVRWSALISLLCFVPLFFVERFSGFFVCLALMGFFWCAALPLVESLTLSHIAANPDRYGRIRLWGSLGFIASVTSVGILLDVIVLDNLLWICALLLTGIFIAALVLPEGGAMPEAITASLRRLLWRPQVRTLLLACFLMSVAHGPLYIFYSIYLDDHGYSKTVIGAFWAVGVLAEIGVFLAMPRLMRHFSVRALLLASFAAATVRFLLIGWGVGFFAVLFAAQLLHALTFGICHATSVAALHRWFPLQQQSRVQGLYGSFSFGAGGLVGALGSGWLWQSLGPHMVYTLAALVAVCGLLLLAFGLAGGDPEPH